MMDLLISQGSNVNATDEMGMTACHYAAFAGHIPAVKLLIKSGGDPDIKDNDEQSCRNILPSAFLDM